MEIVDDSFVAGFLLKAMEQLAAGEVQVDPQEWAQSQLDALVSHGYVVES